MTQHADGSGGAPFLFLFVALALMAVKSCLKAKAR
jgi:hypothetical protein